MKLTKRATLRD